MKVFIPDTTELLERFGTHGTLSATSPSNIALVKYWGKKEVQIPENPSISFTLKNCYTKTTITYNKKETASEGFDFKVYLDDKHQPDFEPKIRQFFERIFSYVPWLQNFSFVIKTSNTFPHSSGIASSASGMSALAFILVSLERQHSQMSTLQFTIKSSYLARLGSGSACRSIEGPVTIWGALPEVPTSSDLYAVKNPLPVHKVFHSYCDTILLVDKGQKQVSSTVGHNLMHNHPYASQRFTQAKQHCSELLAILQSGNLDDFITLVESEALTLHAMMMTSMPYFILMKPNTLEILQAIWKYRKETDSKVCFTLDAGANVHLLYPKNETTTIEKFIQSTLASYCDRGQYITDSVGIGAKIA